MANEPRNLYQYVDFFRLIYEGNRFYIDEPVDWDKVRIKVTKEDTSLFGFNYEFIDPKITVLFEFGITDTGKPGGGDMLRGAYNLQASDAKIGFEYGYEYKGVQEVQFSGNLNFAEYSASDEGVKIQIEKILFDRLVRTRSETKVSLNATKDLDGGVLVPPLPLTLQLHSKILSKYGRGEPPADFTALDGVQRPDQGWWIQPDTTSLTKTELDELFSMPLFVGVDPITEDRFQYKAGEAGNCKLRFSQTFTLHADNTGVLGPILDYKLQPDIVIARNGVIVQTFRSDAWATSGYAAGSIFTRTFTFTAEVNAALQVGDVVYFRMPLYFHSGPGIMYHISGYTGYVEVVQQTVAAASDCKGYRVYDAFRHVLQAITGTADSFQSDFFAPGGPGEKYALTNGYQIRNFDVAKWPVSLSFKDLWDILEPLFCLGIQYTQDEAGFPVVRVEPGKRFYGEERIFDFTDIADYEEYHNKAVTWNEAEVGFEKYADNEANALDDFSTQKTVLLPLQSYKAKYSKKSKGIASGWLIESIRREQFKENPSSSVTNDDALFIIAYVSESTYQNLNYSIEHIPGDSTKAMLYLGRAASFAEGAKLSFSVPSVNAGSLFTIVKKWDALTYEIAPKPNDEAISGGGITLDLGGKMAAERNEAFSLVEGVEAPETAYNLRLSLDRILYNHSEVLNIALAHKLDEDVIQTTEQKQNKNLKTLFVDAEPFKLTDQNYLINEPGPIKLQDFNSRRALFLPTQVKFSAEIHYNDLKFIKTCLVGQSGTAKDFGPVSFPDEWGATWEGYIESLEYDPSSEKVEIIANKKQRIS